MKKTLEKKAAWQRSLGKQVEEKNWHWAGIYMYVSKSCSTPRKTKKKSKSGKKIKGEEQRKITAPSPGFDNLPLQIPIKNSSCAKVKSQKERAPRKGRFCLAISLLFLLKF